MVTFTCNNCGDSVKKNRVEKHFSFECRRKSGGPNVCCIDCLKDFRQDYEAHTSCQTEDERYSAKGTFVAKDPKNKQKNKQLSWSEVIQSIADSGKLIQPSKDILNIIKESDNVPRKEAKFKNFCQNNAHLRRFRLNDILDVFNLIQEEMKKNTEAAKLEKEQALAAAKEKQKNGDPEEMKEKEEVGQKRSIDNSEKMDEDVPTKKVKFAEPPPVEEEIIKPKKKKKKSKKNKSNDSDVDLHFVDSGTDYVETNGVIKKKKKKNKNKFLDTTTEVAVVNEIGATNCELTNGHSKSKKKKNKLSNGTGETNDVGLTNGHNNSLKKNKKHSISDELKQNKDSVEGKEVETKSPKKNKRESLEPEKTQFKDVIAKLLKPGTEFKLKSLKKMVFAVYKSGEEEVPREVRENFNKKLLKIPNVEMNEKVVKLVK